MKSTALALASILSVTSAAWSAPAPSPLTYTHLAEIVQSASDDPRILKSLVGAHLVLDLRPDATHPHFVAAENIHGMAFICQSDFGDFAGGPVAATVIKFEPGEDDRDHVKLSGCTTQER